MTNIDEHSSPGCGKNALWKGMALGLIATAFWGSFYPVGRVLFGVDTDSVNPLNLTFLRFSFASLFLSPMLFNAQNRKAAGNQLKHHWLEALSLAAIGIIGEGLLVFWALKFTTAARASLLANASPISTVLISCICGRELLTRNKVSGMLLGFLGIVLAFWGGGGDLFSSGKNLLTGDLMALGSGICWAVYTVYGTGITSRCGGMLANGILFTFGALLMLPVLLVTGSGPDFDLPWRVWAGAFYLGALANGLANGLWYTALKYVTPGELGSCGYVSALLTFTISVLFLNEHATWQFITSVILVLGGVALMLKRK